MKYILHDAIVNDIVCNDDGIELCFGKGVYVMNEQNGESELSGPCRMSIQVKYLDGDNILEHIIVKRINKSMITDMKFDDFLKSVRNNSFKLYIDYYSFFGESVLLIGDCGQDAIFFTVTEIDSIDYIL